MKKSNTSLFFKALALGYILLLSACANSSSNQDQQEEQHDAQQIIEENEIEVGSIQRKRVEKSVSVMGRVEAPPQSRASIFPLVDAFVKKVYVIKGQRVEPGQKLVALSHPSLQDLQLQYLQAKSRLEESQANYLRKQKLSEKNAISDREVEMARSNYLSDQSEKSRLAATLKNLGLDPENVNESNLQDEVYLRSPLPGNILQNEAQVGQLAATGQALMEIVSQDHLHLELSVPPTIFEKVNAGQKVRFTSAHSEKAFEGEIYLVNQTADESGFFNAHAHFHDPENRLRPGTSVKAQVIYQSDSLWALPTTAVYKKEGKLLTLVVEGNELKEMPVTPGVRSDSLQAVVNHSDFKNKKVLMNRVQYLLTEKSSEGHSH